MQTKARGDISSVRLYIYICIYIYTRDVALVRGPWGRAHPDSGGCHTITLCTSLQQLLGLSRLPLGVGHIVTAATTTATFCGPVIARLPLQLSEREVAWRRRRWRRPSPIRPTPRAPAPAPLTGGRSGRRSRSSSEPPPRAMRPKASVLAGEGRRGEGEREAGRDAERRRRRLSTSGEDERLELEEEERLMLEGQRERQSW